jgi:hypothetical protein
VNARIKAIVEILVLFFMLSNFFIPFYLNVYIRAV